MKLKHFPFLYGSHSVDSSERHFSIDDLRQLMHSDYTRGHVACREISLSSISDESETRKCYFALLENYEEKVEHIGIVVDALDDLSIGVLSHLHRLRDQSKQQSLVQTLHPDSRHTPVSNRDLHFSSQVFVYCDRVAGNRDQYVADARDMGFTLRIRDNAYWQEQTKTWTPEIFICHDYRNKEEFVEPLANALIIRNTMVWYDRFCITVGDSLIDKIDEGLVQCKFGALVISSEFLERKPWSKREFKSLVTRELEEGRKILLPIWLGVTKREVLNYSPELADKKAIDASIGVDRVASLLANEVKNAQS